MKLMFTPTTALHRLCLTTWVPHRKTPEAIESQPIALKCRRQKYVCNYLKKNYLQLEIKMCFK